jgi:hypothetical protein
VGEKWLIVQLQGVGITVGLLKCLVCHHVRARANRKKTDSTLIIRSDNTGIIIHLLPGTENQSGV